MLTLLVMHSFGFAFTQKGRRALSGMRVSECSVASCLDGSVAAAKVRRMSMPGSSRRRGGQLHASPSISRFSDDASSTHAPHTVPSSSPPLAAAGLTTGAEDTEVIAELAAQTATFATELQAYRSNGPHSRVPVGRELGSPSLWQGSSCAHRPHGRSPRFPVSLWCRPMQGAWPL